MLRLERSFSMRICSPTFSKPLIASITVALLSACGGESAIDNQAPTLQAAPLAAAPGASITFPNPRNNYVISRTANGFQVTDSKAGTAAVPVAIDASLIFSDMTINLSIGEQSKTIAAANLRTLIELYIAFFNRVPDADGLAYWIQQMKAGMSIDQLANNFYSAAVQYPTLTGYSSTMSSAEFVKIIYKNVLGRSGTNAPPDTDVNYWAGELNSGKATKGTLVTTMLNAAHGFSGDATWGWVPQLLDNKISVGNYFAIEQGLGYVDPNDAISKGIAIAAQVTANSIIAAKNLINVSDNNFNLLGTSPFGTGVGNSRDCLNTDLYKPGTSFYTEMSTNNRRTNETQTASVTYSVNGATTFNGISALEMVMDTMSLSGPSAGIGSQLKSYIALNSDEMLNYGSTQTVRMGTDFDYRITTINTPPERSPFTLAVNQAYTQTYSTKQDVVSTNIKTNVTTTSSYTSSSTDSVTFLGIEAVSVPAGNFYACKFKHIDSGNGTNTLSYSWNISEGPWRGMLAKAESADELTVITKLSFKK